MRITFASVLSLSNKIQRSFCEKQWLIFNPWRFTTQAENVIVSHSSCDEFCSQETKRTQTFYCLPNFSCGYPKSYMNILRHFAGMRWRTWLWLDYIWLGSKQRISIFERKRDWLKERKSFGGESRKFCVKNSCCSYVAYYSQNGPSMIICLCPNGEKGQSIFLQIVLTSPLLLTGSRTACTVTYVLLLTPSAPCMASTSCSNALEVFKIIYFGSSFF